MFVWSQNPLVWSMFIAAAKDVYRNDSRFSQSFIVKKDVVEKWLFNVEPAIAAIWLPLCHVLCLLNMAEMVARDSAYGRIFFRSVLFSLVSIFLIFVVAWIWLWFLELFKHAFFQGPSCWWSSHPGPRYHGGGGKQGGMFGRGMISKKNTRYFSWIKTQFLR